MEGRSLGTERPSVSLGGGESRPARSPEGGRFTTFLRSRTAEGTGGARKARESIEDDVASRIRDGRTDAADEAPRREPVAREGREVREERAANRREDADRQTSRESEKTGSERRSAEFRAGSEASGAQKKDGLSSRERSVGLTDASDAQGASEDVDAPDEAPFAPILAPPVHSSPLAAPVIGGGGAAAARAITGIALQGAGLAAAGANRGSQTTNPNALPTARTVAASRAASVQQAAPKPGSTAMQRADAILDQLRMRIQSGEREATINLNPAELGRIRMHVRVDGGSISAAITAESAETLAVLEAHAPELRAWLSRDGAEHVELDLELMTPADAEDRSSFERSETDGRTRQRRGSSDADAAAVAAAPEALVRALATRSADGGVDLVA